MWLLEFGSSSGRACNRAIQQYAMYGFAVFEDLLHHRFSKFSGFALGIKEENQEPKNKDQHP
jgi:hypothetical protein